jgi:hypothetical protein
VCLHFLWRYLFVPLDCFPDRIGSVLRWWGRDAPTTAAGTAALRNRCNVEREFMAEEDTAESLQSRPFDPAYRFGRRTAGSRGEDAGRESIQDGHQKSRAAMATRRVGGITETISTRRRFASADRESNRTQWPAGSPSERLDFFCAFGATSMNANTFINPLSLF